MSIRIGKLATACHVPRNCWNEASIVDQFAQGRFAVDLAAHLGPSLSRQPGIVRIRRLPVRVIIPAADLTESALSRAWTEAFSRALFTALAYSTGAGPFEVFRAESAATFVAEAIRDLLDGTATGKWQYAEFEELFRSGPNAASIALLGKWPHLTLSILVELENIAALERLLPRLDELALERLFVILAPAADSEPAPLSFADIFAAAKLLVKYPPLKFALLRARSYALRLYVHARRTNETARSPRSIFHSLLALSMLLTEELPFLSQIPPGHAQSKHIPPPILALLRAVAQEVHFAPQSQRVSQLEQILLDVRHTLRLPPRAATTDHIPWIASNWCGLFFLAGTLERLGWISSWRKLDDFKTGGISPLIAGLCLTICREFHSQPQALDPGLAVFAGYLADPDLAHLRRVFHEFPTETRRNVLRAALADETNSETWALALERLAEVLIRAFASRIRGFHKTSSQGIVKTFLQRSGRIRIEDERILVQLNPSAYDVALHISGMDAAIDSVSWFGGRKLEFEMGDI